MRSGNSGKCADPGCDPADLSGDLATTGAQSLLIQQNKDNLAASTQTSIADNIATQTQVCRGNITMTGSDWLENKGDTPPLVAPASSVHNKT